MIGKTRIIFIGLCVCLTGLIYAEAPQFFETRKTERLDFPPGGLLSLKNSTGDVTVQGWDRSDVELTTTLSTKDPFDAQGREKALKELDLVHVTTERHGDELVIQTDFPKYGHFQPLLGPKTRFDIAYEISVPRKARVSVEHGTGYVGIDDITGDIHVTASQGEITVRLPEDGHYAIDAKSKLGDVLSDFGGRTERKMWFLGKQLTGEASGAAQKIFLRAGYGDIIILKSATYKKPAQ